VSLYIGEDILTASSFSEGILSQFCALVQEMPKRRFCNIWADAALQLMGLNLLDCTLHIQASNIFKVHIQASNIFKVHIQASNIFKVHI
jgi:hypothetical protein